MPASGDSTKHGRDSPQEQAMTAKRILFRADASERIGSGHVMRCLTLANALRAEAAECVFVAASMPESLVRRVQFAGHETLLLPEAALASDRAIEEIWGETEQARDSADCLEAITGRSFDWVIVDHYGLDRVWETALRCVVPHIMVIDDLANRSHHCDLLLDQNLGRKPADYADLVPPSAKILAGPQYALLRPEFAAARPAALKRREVATLSRLLISLGGSDPDNVTGRVLSILNDMVLPEGVRITAVLGALAGSLDAVRASAAKMRYPTEVLVDVRDMAALMSECDLAIGAAGATAWERCCLGLPSLVVVLAENQRPGAEALARAGAAVTISLEALPSFHLKAFFAPASGASQAMIMSTVAAGTCHGRGAELVSGVLHA
jgi:UDP-2,4-diacetamido-2,4,6-trideoxy-beta-L-altropyranose hydrolase